MATRSRSHDAPARVRRRAPARAGRAPALLLFLPSAALLVFALWQRGRSLRPLSPSTAPTEPERVGRDGETPGWDGSVALGEGVTLSGRLERLHPVAERQRFDVNALREHFPHTAVPGGEPWRLVLTAAGDGGADGVVAVGALADTGVGELVFLSSGAGSAGVSGPLHPLSSLLTPPTGALRTGETVSLVLWGEAPEGVVAVKLPGVEAELRLVPSVREGSMATSSLAAIDARGEAAPGEEDRR